MIRTCPHCQKTFKPEMGNVRKGKGKYCSMRCAGPYRKKRPEADRFWEKVDQSGGPDACWPWTAYIRADGYGEFAALGKPRPEKAYRAAFRLSRGREPIGFVLHSCDNRKCCNPSHLREGSHQENTQDAVERSRYRHGSNHWRSEFTEQEVLQIREHVAGGGTQRSMALRFGVSKMTISDIISRRTWAWLKPETDCAQPPLPLSEGLRS